MGAAPAPRAAVGGHPMTTTPTPRAAILREAIRQHREAARDRAIAAEADRELRRLFAPPPEPPAYRALRR
jgi:hypothetical protein